jgi:hypothetical protein
MHAYTDSSCRIYSSTISGFRYEIVNNIWTEFHNAGVIGMSKLPDYLKQVINDIGMAHDANLPK